MSGVGCDYLMIPKKNMMYCTVVLKVGNVPSSSLVGAPSSISSFYPAVRNGSARWGRIELVTFHLPRSTSHFPGATSSSFPDYYSPYLSGIQTKLYRCHKSKKYSVADTTYSMYTVTHLLAWGRGHGAWGIPWDDTAPHPRGTVAAGSFSHPLTWYCQPPGVGWGRSCSG